LIESGHRWPDVLGFTLMQFRAFTEAAQRARRRNLADELVNIRAAAKYDGKGFKSYLKGLTDG